MKKKLTALILVFVMLFCAGLSACKDSNSNQPPPAPPPGTENEAETYTVTFMNGSEVFITQKIEDGKTAAKPSNNPSKTNYTFTDWHEELNADGTGKGTAFNFSMAITKNITLHAAYTENASVTAYVYYGVLYYAQKLYESETFYPSGYGMEAYDFSDWDVAVLEEAADFSIDAKYAYFDIRQLAAESAFDNISYIAYMYSGTDVDYWLEDYGDYIKSNVYDDDWNVSYYVSAQDTLTIVTDNSTYDEYYIIQDTAYQITEWISIEGSITADAAFWSEYCSESAVLLRPNSYTLKAGYIEVYFNLGSTYESLIIEEGQSIDLSVYEIEGYDVSFLYNKYVEADVALADSEVLSVERIARYMSFLSETEDLDLYFNENFDEMDEYDYYYNIWGTADDFIVHIEDAAYFYYFNVVDGAIVYGQYTTDDGNVQTDYALIFDAVTQSCVAYQTEYAEFTGTIPSDQFTIYKTLGWSFGVVARYLKISKPLELDTEYTVDEETVFSLTVDESGIYTIELDVPEGNDDLVSIYSDAGLADVIGYFWTSWNNSTLVLLKGQTYYFEFRYDDVSPYSFTISKSDTPYELEEGLVLNTGYNGTIADDKFYAYTFIPETDGIYTLTVTMPSQGSYLYALISDYINFSSGCGEGDGTDTFTFTAELEAGTTYYIQVDGDAGAQFTLMVELNN